jgi:hypothetical protein
MGRPTLLTPEVHKVIVATIRAGAYDWVAAEANGIDRETFKLWMRVGEREKREPYLSFLNDVRTARAQARAAAELEVRKDQPFNWLRFGPGRERENAEGWTESKEVRHSGSIDVVHSVEWSRIATTIEQALGPYPEAKLAVATALKLLGPAPEDAIDVAREES